MLYRRVLSQLSVSEVDCTECPKSSAQPARWGSQNGRRNVRGTTAFRACVPVVYTWGMTKEAPEFVQDDCPFCGVVSHDSRDQIFFSSDDVVAFLDIDPATRGHTLVVPRIHAATAFDMNEEQFSATMSGVWRVANLLRQRLNPEGLTLIQSNGAAAWQDVFHIHVHLIPRYQGDDLVRPWGDGAGTLESVGYVDNLNALTADLRGASGYDARSAL